MPISSPSLCTCGWFLAWRDGSSGGGHMRRQRYLKRKRGESQPQPLPQKRDDLKKSDLCGKEKERCIPANKGSVGGTERGNPIWEEGALLLLKRWRRRRVTNVFLLSFL